MAWRYLVRRLNGDGTETPLQEVSFIEAPSITDVLSGPPECAATVEPEVASLLANDGRPLFLKWNTAIVAESDGEIQGAWIVVDITENEASYALDLAGYSSYPGGQPYMDAHYWVQEDPANLYRHIWNHVQSQPHANLGVRIDTLTTPVRIGDVLEEVQFNAETSPGVTEMVSFEAGPYKLNWYSSLDLGAKLDDLAEETPFDWIEKHSWNGEAVDHFIQMGYPRIGRRRTDQWLEVGVNCAVTPVVTDPGGEYANVVFVIGAGEGTAAIRGQSSPDNLDGVRRATVVEDKSIKSGVKANDLAVTEARVRRDTLGVDSITVFDHPNLRVEEISLGDEIRLFGRTAWRDLDVWVRILTRTRTPDADDIAVLTVERADRGVE